MMKKYVILIISLLTAAGCHSKTSALNNEDFLNIPMADYVEFVTKSIPFYDHVFFDFDDGTAVAFVNTSEWAEYGVWDFDSGMTKVLGRYSLDDSGTQYIYEACIGNLHSF
ncbi:MAG: hypothetical protein Q4C73_03000 [Eubacteriales bacterium]|nr:hypothetical protein [Eubacteriales bacterium]